MKSMRFHIVVGTVVLTTSVHGTTAAWGALHQAQAPGHPIVTPISEADCAQAQRIYDRLHPGMEIQEEALERTARQLDEARRGTLLTTDALKRALFAGLVNEARALVPELAYVKIRLAGIDTTTLTEQQREALADALEIATNTEAIVSSFAEGSQYGEGFTDPGRLAMESTAERVHEAMQRLKQLLFDSGIAEAVAERGTGVVAIAALRRSSAGLLGEAIYRGVKLRMDVLLLGAGGVLDHATATKAEENLDIMNREYHEIRNTVIEATRVLRECGIPVPPQRPRRLQILRP